MNPVSSNEFDVSIVIPAYNEEAAIGTTLDEIAAVLSTSTRRYEMIVVDDGSRDKTGAVAAERGARVTRHRHNRGYGAALKTGTMASRGRVVLFYDADNQFDPHDIERMVDAVGDADVALGARTSGPHAPTSRKGGQVLLGWVANYLSHTKIPDLNCGLRAIHRDLLMDYLHLLPDGFSASTTTTLVLLREGYDVQFVPVTVKKRAGKRTVRPFQDGLDTALLAIRLTTLLAPLRVFGLASLAFFAFGILWGARCLAQGLGLSNFSLFMLFSAVMIFFFGLLADQVASLRRERRHHSERKS